jgi:IS30 family transposase
MAPEVPGGWSAAEQDEIWERRGPDESLRTIARRFNTHLPSIRRFLMRTGGRRLPPPRRAAGALSAAEREEVSRGLAAHESYRRIAARLGRAPAPAGGRPEAGLRRAGPADPHRGHRVR